MPESCNHRVCNVENASPNGCCYFQTRFHRNADNAVPTRVSVLNDMHPHISCKALDILSSFLLSAAHFPGGLFFAQKSAFIRPFRYLTKSHKISLTARTSHNHPYSLRRKPHVSQRNQQLRRTCYYRHFIQHRAIHPAKRHQNHAGRRKGWR